MSWYPQKQRVAAQQPSTYRIAITKQACRDGGVVFLIKPHFGAKLRGKL